jgi:hypothetical protein
LLVRPSAKTILTAQTPNGDEEGTMQVLRLLPAPVTETTSMTPAEKFRGGKDVFEAENKNWQRAERSELLEKSSDCIRFNSVHALACNVTTVSPAKEDSVGSTAMMEGCGPNSVIDSG